MCTMYLGVKGVFLNSMHSQIIIGQFLIVWFNNCVLGKSDQIANVDPYRIIVYVHIYACKSRKARN